jgi:hypothetical protein
MTLLAELAWVARLVALAGGVALIALGLAHVTWRWRRALPAVGRIEELARRGYAGLDVVPLHDEGMGLALATRSSPPEGSAVLLDTRPDADVPDGLAPMHLGVSALDTFFLVRAGTEAAARGLDASRAQLRATSAFFDGWRRRLGTVSVTTDRVRFAFDRDQLALFDRALPTMAHVAGLLLSAVRWYPPAEMAARGGGAFRQAGADQAPTWFIEAPGGTIGPLALPEVIALLRAGRVSWLTRASQGEGGPLLPLCSHDALASVRVPVTDPAAPPAAAPPAPRRRIRRAVLALSQVYTVAGVFWLMLTIASLFAEPNLRRAAYGAASVRWPSTDGRIVSSRLVTDHDSSDDKRYSAAVRYSYEVDGAQYVGDRVLFYYRSRFEGHTYDRSLVDPVLRRYPVGRQVRVHYEPGAPKNSVLEPGLVGAELAAGAVALGFVGLATLLLLVMAAYRVYAWRLRRRARHVGLRDLARSTSRSPPVIQSRS